MDVRQIQTKLSRWAETAPDRTFSDLYNLLCDPEWLTLAHDHVKRNAGSVTAGCDGVNLAKFDADFGGNLGRLSAELKTATFLPSPVRRVNLPKPNGKIRSLGIPTVRDRIVQEALRMALEPIFESDFSQYSFGFRPNRCTMDAVKAITWSTQESKKFFWVVEGDIACYFDSVHHRKLLKLLRRRVHDQKILDLVWAFLRAGVMEDKLFRDTRRGVPQGGIISPLLANVFLHELDAYMHNHYTHLTPKEKSQRRKQGLANFSYCRYADDFVVLCNGTKQQAEMLKQELRVFLRTHLKLELSLEKTRVTHLNDGIRFLGFWIQRKHGGKGMTTKVDVPAEAIETIRATIIQMTSRSTCADSVNTKILALNRVIGGWCRYYQYSSRAATVFNRLSHLVFWRFAHWLGSKFKLSMPQVMKKYRQADTFVNETYRLIPAREYKTLVYRQRFLKPNPFTSASDGIERESLLEGHLSWTGREARPGTADLRLTVLKRDRFTCQACGVHLTQTTAEIDHRKPVRHYRHPRDATFLANLITNCIPCHQAKTRTKR